MSPFARGVVHGPETGDKRAQAAEGRRRTLALPALPADTPADEYVDVAEAAALLECSQQSIQKSIKGGHLVAYQHAGRRVCLVADLAQTRAADRQRDDQSRREWDRFRHEYTNPPELPWLAPYEFVCPADCTYPGCENAEHERVGNEPAPAPVRKPASPARLAGLAKARAALAAKRAAG